MMKRLFILFFLLIFFSGPAFAGVGLYGNPVPLIIYKDRNSPVRVKLYDLDNTVFTAAEMAAITKAEIKYIPANGEDSESIDSATCAACFDWSTYASQGEILIDVGSIAFTAGRDRQAELIVYTASETAGRVVGRLDMQISEDAVRDATMIDPLTTSIALNDINDVDTSGGETGYVLTQKADRTFNLQSVGAATVTNSAVEDAITAGDTVTTASDESYLPVITSGNMNKITLTNFWALVSNALATIGDMLASVYDTDGNEIVDYAEAVNDGTNSKTAEQITNHIDATNNPHEVTAAQAGAVANTGDETIAGVKTFSSSPIVPDPTTAQQAAPRGWVINQIGSTSGTMNTVEEGGSQVGDSDISILNFIADVFNITEPVDGEIQIDIDESGLDHNSLNNYSLERHFLQADISITHDQISDVNANTDLTADLEEETHASEHQSGGADEIKLDDLGVPDDNTDLDASILRHGLMEKLPNDSDVYYNGVGGWTTPSGSGGSAIVLDIGDDGGDDSTDISEFATSGDTTGIVSEPAADKLLMDMSKNWPTANVAEAGDSATAFFDTGTIEDARLPAGLTRDTEWDSAAKINAATTDADFLTSESDPGVTTHELTYNHDNYTTAYGWGDHSAQNYLDKDTDTYVETESDPTVDSSAEIQAIIGVDVYEPAFAYGTGAGEIDASDIPINDTNENITATNTDAALTELAGYAETPEDITGEVYLFGTAFDITLNWSVGNDNRMTHTQVWRATGPGYAFGTVPLDTVVIGTTEYNDTSGNTDTWYKYKTRTTDGSGNYSDYSASILVYVDSEIDESLIDDDIARDSEIPTTPGEVGAEPADATILKDADIGSTVQGYSATLDDRFYNCCIPQPGNQYDNSVYIPLDRSTDTSIVITEVGWDCDSASYELDADLMYADSLIGMANATVLIALDTTSGTFSATEQTLNVAEGKAVYIRLNADPSDNIKWTSFKAKY